jgi:hypothetical protein
MATVVAATAALALASAAPALADHETPTTKAGNVSCEDLGLELLGSKVDPPVSVDNQFYTATVTEVDGEPALLDVVAKPGFVIDAVLVKGSNETNVFVGPDFSHMFSPDAGQSGKPAAISHYEVCGGEEDETPPPPPPPNGTETPTETPTEEPTKEPTPEPTTPVTPKPVPTSVPAGYGDADNGTAGTIGLLAFATALAVGGAALVSRRFLKDN